MRLFLLAIAALMMADTFAVGPDGKLYVTTTQIHLPPTERGPYEIYRFAP